MDSENKKSGENTARKTSRSETGHIINIGNFKKLLLYIEGFGAAYQPSNEAITLKRLQERNDKITAAMSALTERISVMQIAENSRRETFAPLKKLSTRIINALSACDVSELTIEDARLLVNKMQGNRSTRQSTSEEALVKEEEDNSISTSQQSFNQLVAHFKDLKTLAIKQKQYNPKEKGLSKEELETYATELNEANKQCILAERDLKNARIERDKWMYREKDGMVVLTKMVKSQVLSMFDAIHPDYLKVRSIPFRTILLRKKTKKK